MRWFLTISAGVKLLALIKWEPSYFHSASLIQKWLNTSKLLTILPPIQLKLFVFEHWLPLTSLLNCNGDSRTCPPRFWTVCDILHATSLKYRLPPIKITLFSRSYLSIWFIFLREGSEWLWGGGNIVWFLWSKILKYSSIVSKTKC